MYTVYSHLGTMTFPERRDAEAYFISLLQVAAEDDGWIGWAGFFFDAGRRIL